MPHLEDEPCVNVDQIREPLMTERFWQLPDGRRLIHSWFDRGWNNRHNDEANCFEPFIFTWFALNGWAECVIDSDGGDFAWVRRVARDSAIAQGFSELLTEDSGVHASATAFARFWPIPRMQHVRK